MLRLRESIALLAAFTIGALNIEVRSLRRERDLAVQVEESYFTGMNDGHNNGVAECRRDARLLAPTLGVIVRDLPDGAQEIVPTVVGHIEEDSPEWDCHTMGNRQCGPGVE